ncbi:Uncharacterised protein [Mycobacteroides abscessus subsp. abscessus]|nr:Uncharacterised protein [Mycobacteroides abscessus subsp. abscessus]
MRDSSAWSVKFPLDVVVICAPLRNGCPPCPGVRFIPVTPK